MALDKLTEHKSQGTDQNPAELITAGVTTISSVINKFINSTFNMEEFPGEWKESIIVPIHKKTDKADGVNYRGVSILSTTYKILSNIVMSRLPPYAEEITGNNQWNFDATCSY